MVGIKESLMRRFLLRIATGSLLLAFVVGFAAFMLEYSAESKRASDTLEALSETVRVSASVAAFSRNELIAADVVNGLVQSHIVAEAWITSDFNNGTEIFSLKRSAREINEKEDQLFTWALHSPIDSTEVIGTLGVRKNAQVIEQIARGTAFRYALFLVVQIPLLAILFTLFFRRIIGTPLTRITAAIKHVKPGSTMRISMPPKHENSEIGMLVQSTNILLEATEHAILEERRAEAEKNEIEQHFQRVFATTSIGVMILKADGKLLSYNPVLERISGYSAEFLSQVKQNDFFNVLFVQPEHAWSMVHEAESLGTTIISDLQVKNKKSDQTELWVNCTFSVTSNEEGDTEFIEGVFFDVTKRRASESEARKAAEIDALTQLVNRRGVEIFLDRALRQASSKKSNVAVLLLDLDGFKSVNDVHGHAAGDIVLKEIAERMRARVRRSSDLASRLGGDEFVVVVVDFGVSTQLLEQLASDLVELISEPIAISPLISVNVGASIGISYAPLHGQTRDELLQAADNAMYGVKARGKNNYGFADLGETPALKV